MARDRRLTADESTFITKVMVLGSQTALPIRLSGTEVARLIGVIYQDTDNLRLLSNELRGLIVPPQCYYETELSWFEQEYEMPEDTDYISIFLQGKLDIPDFITYLRYISELHKRRRKYSKILIAQPLPKMVQVSPRALLEYGGMQIDALASWITWRKWFYDLDNRSAQESGYLFEPILAASLGGEPASGRNSPIRRTRDANKRRQVDCILVKPDGTMFAYEFKLRVTIAASGQGRFAEELDFATDCRNSGYTPVLIVLDPTPNPRLADLGTAFRDAGGEAYIGDDAWQHLEQEAGETMSRFIENYVREPIRQISTFEGELHNFEVRRLENGNVEIQLGQVRKLIVRHEDILLAMEDDDEE